MTFARVLLAIIFALLPQIVTAEPSITVKLNDAELQDGAVIESIDDVLISTSDSSAATLTGRLSAQDTDQLDMSKIALPILNPVYVGIATGQENFRVTEDNCSTKQLAPGTAAGSSCDVTLTPRATKPGFFTGKLLVKAGSYETEIPLFGQARNFCAPEPAVMMTSSCSQPCGGGTQTTTFTDGCGATWSDTSACNTQACDAYNWNTSQYGSCSAVCDGGIQFRDVWCERFSDGARVADSFCADAIKPAGSAQCNTTTCYRDYKVCGWIPDIPVELAYRGYRLQVVDEDNPDAYRYVSNTCEPDLYQSTPIDDRVTGCEAVHFEYPNDKVSHGAKKWFVTATDEPLTQCIESTDIVYPWTLVAVDWDEKDEDLEAYRTRRYQITVNEQPIFVSSPKVHDGEEAVPYQLIDSKTLGTGETYQEVCMVYEHSYVEETYLRPAGTNYVRNAGPGDPIYVSGEDQHMVDGQCVDIIETYLIAVNDNRTNLDVASELTAQGWDGIEPVHLQIDVASGVTLSSTSTAVPAITIPTLPEESTAVLINNGTIVGRGGNGASGGRANGQNGGPAIRTLADLEVRNFGIIGGGGGGGGTTSVANSGNCYNSCQPLSGGGGGGAGAPSGSGGIVPSSVQVCSGGNLYGTGGGNHGASGSLLSGGNGGSPYSCGGFTGGRGGNGGALGQNGTAGVRYSGYAYGVGAGGTAGAAMIANGNSITWTELGDVRGAIQ
ncbi:MAG: thrombospondin type-1 domain-containing protein [Porticoccaceae bacterium]